MAVEFRAGQHEYGVGPGGSNRGGHVVERSVDRHPDVIVMRRRQAAADHFQTVIQLATELARDRNDGEFVTDDDPPAQALAPGPPPVQPLAQRESGGEADQRRDR